MKILYAGSPEAAAVTLKILIERQKECGFEIAGVLSNPPTAKGRHKTPTPTPVAALAEEYHLPVYTPEHLDSAAREQISPLGADLLVVFAYGHIFGPKFMELFPMGGINLHPSLLPKYRGCTPVPAAILNRDEKTAATIQYVSEKMDEGNILAQQIINLDGTETSESLLLKSAEIGAQLFCNLLSKNHLPEGKPQTGEASYTKMITKEDARINWKESSSIIEAKIRAYYPDPACWCMENIMGNQQPLKILSATCIDGNDERAVGYSSEPDGKVVQFVKSEGIYIKTGSGLLCVKELQRQGKKAMGWKDFMNGAKDFIGSVLE